MATWRGVTLDGRSAEMMDEVVRLCPGIIIDPIQGSWSGSVSGSAGTHDGAGAIDLAAEHLSPAQRDQLVLAMRRVGWAAWVRNPSQSDWPWHIHGVAVGEEQLSNGAHDQVQDYLEGRNGLASGAPDDGPRDFHHVGITWEQYQANELEVDEMAAATVVFFRTQGAWYASYPGAGVYRIMPDNKTLEDLKTVVTRAGGTWTVHSDKPVENIDAFGVKIP